MNRLCLPVAVNFDCAELLHIFGAQNFHPLTTHFWCAKLSSIDYSVSHIFHTQNTCWKNIIRKLEKCPNLLNTH